MVKASEILMDKTFPHGTLEGSQLGCKGSHCPGKETVGMTCEAIAIRYAGDLSFKRRLDAGLSIEAILFEDSEAEATAKKPTTSKATHVTDLHGNAYAVSTVSVADSETPVDEFDDVPASQLVAALGAEHVESVEDEQEAASAFEVFEPPRRGRKPEPIKHGTKHAYDRRGCKTDEGCPGDPVTGLTCRMAARGMTLPPVVGEVTPAAEKPTKLGTLVEQVQAAEQDIAATVAEAAETMSFDEAAIELSGEFGAEGERPRVRADDLLLDLADQKTLVENLREDLADANAKAKHHEREAISYFEANNLLVKELRQVQTDAAALGEQLIQAGFSLDVAKAKPVAGSASMPGPEIRHEVIVERVAGGVRLTVAGMTFAPQQLLDLAIEAIAADAA